MSHEAMLISFVLLAVLLFAAFGMQRATLLLSREANTSSQATAMLLPAWFPAVWLPRIAKWALLLYIAFSWSWWVALGLLIGELVLSAVLPIPYRLYVPTFRRRIGRLRRTNAELAKALDALLSASKLNAS
jgi:hypothetical protein